MMSGRFESRPWGELTPLSKVPVGNRFSIRELRDGQITPARIYYRVVGPFDESGEDIIVSTTIEHELGEVLLGSNTKVIDEGPPPRQQLHQRPL